MAAILKQTTKIARRLSNQKLLSAASFNGTRSLLSRAVVSGIPVRFASSTSSFSYLEKKTAPRRLPAVYRFLLQADERTHSTGNEPIPKITLSHVSVSFAGYVDSRSHTEDTNTASTKTKTNKPNTKKGKKGNQKPNTNTANKARVRSINTAGTKIIMKLDVKNAHWLSERVRERIMLMEKSRIKDGELVLTSTKTRKQENNFEDVVAKKQKLLGKFQEIINAASYAPLPPSDGLAKKLTKLAVMGKERNAA